jgi:methionyl-tRNA synthetase
VPKLGITQDVHFIRTTDEHHVVAAQEFWRKCLANGDIYKSRYQVKYCVGCELEKTDSELVEGECTLHPGREIELIDEENYFFKFSKFEKPLLELYRKYPDFVLPDHRLTEIRKFVEAGLKDFSVSRVKDKMPWGIPVPDDAEQVMYVWFDALVNYISTLGWPVYQSQTPVQGTATSQFPEGEPTEAKFEPTNSKSQISSNTQISNFEKFWGSLEDPQAMQIAGKDNLRQQSAMWQAMLLSAGLPPTRRILIHGFITSDGQKMSKTVGNVVSPFEIMDALEEKGVAREQAIDALRYYLALEIPTFEDGDFTWEKFWESYNANLANGLGNLVSRVLKMAANANLDFRISNLELSEEFRRYLDQYEIQKAGEWVWKKIKDMDEYIAREEPFKVVKVDPEKGKKQIEHLLLELESIAFHLQPFLPNTAGKILGALENLGNLEPLRLFPRV